jgi:2-polyprenyl-6-methoxyphenol hydroxylase-like FAD-dependent oxidoreductase
MTTNLASAHDIVDVQNTDCCIVGGGPAGVVLGLLLARQGIPVKLLEVHKDFDHDFRGDTIHPSVMEIKVQRQREFPTRIIQAFQSFIQERIFSRALNSQQFQPRL